MSKSYGAIESNLRQPSAGESRWRIEHSDGRIEEITASSAFLACQALRWHMSDCVRFDQIESVPCEPSK